MAQTGTQLMNGLVKFYTRDEIKRYFRNLIDYYQEESTSYGDKLGTLLRGGEQVRTAPKPEEREKVQAKGWTRMGSLMVNVNDPVTGMTEIMIQLHDDFKQKLTRTSEALKSFEAQAGTIIPERGSYTVYLRNGVPEKIVVDSRAKKQETFNFSAEFRVV